MAYIDDGYIGLNGAYSQVIFAINITIITRKQILKNSFTMYYAFVPS